MNREAALRHDAKFQRLHRWLHVTTDVLPLQIAFACGVACSDLGPGWGVVAILCTAPVFVCNEVLLRLGERHLKKIREHLEKASER